jgi:hypothetical protein
MKSLILALCAVLLFTACKSTKKLFNEGNYDRALFSALDDLKKNPGNATAAALLPQAYQEAVNQHENTIAAARQGTVNVQKLQTIYQQYQLLQKIYDGVYSTPASRGIVAPKNYAVELSDAAENTAGYFYDKGMDLVGRGDRPGAQQAYVNFKAAASYVPGFKDVDDRMNEAYGLAVVNVVVDKFDQRFGYYNVNGNFFQNDITYNLNNIGKSHYYRFYAPGEAQAKEIRVDQYMDINVYDIWFGQLYANNYSYTVSKDITETDQKDPKNNRTITVTATVNVTRRMIDSRAMMDYHITDAANRRLIAYDRIPAQYAWEKLTGNYSGDSRALGDKDWAIVRGAFNNQPGYDELYRELTRSLMNNFNSRMQAIYGR